MHNPLQLLFGPTNLKLIDIFYITVLTLLNVLFSKHSYILKRGVGPVKNALPLLWQLLCEDSRSDEK